MTTKKNATKDEHLTLFHSMRDILHINKMLMGKVERLELELRNFRIQTELREKREAILRTALQDLLRSLNNEQYDKIFTLDPEQRIALKEASAYPSRQAATNDN